MFKLYFAREQQKDVLFGTVCSEQIFGRINRLEFYSSRAFIPTSTQNGDIRGRRVTLTSRSLMVYNYEAWISFWMLPCLYVKPPSYAVCWLFSEPDVARSAWVRPPHSVFHSYVSVTWFYVVLVAEKDDAQRTFFTGIKAFFISAKFCKWKRVTKSL